MGAIDRHALRLVERGGVAVIDRSIILRLERDARALSSRTFIPSPDTCSIVPSVPFFTPSDRSFRRNIKRSPRANARPGRR
jgi:hypothetical protein